MSNKEWHKSWVRAHLFDLLARTERATDVRASLEENGNKVILSLTFFGATEMEIGGKDDAVPRMR